MEKMREEFENSVCVLLGLSTRCPDGDKFDCYYDRTTDTYWSVFKAGWKKSRAAQCVKLPQKELDMGSDTFWFTWDIEEALDAAGIRYT